MKLAHRVNSKVAAGTFAVLAACAPTATVVTIMATALTACASMTGRSGPGEVIDDSLISSKVKAAFAADPEVKATEVQVETYKGVVQLSGFVDNEQMVRRAVEIARGVKGVKSVKNNLLLRKAAG
jgi:osmotically-inducible protein OsmY